MLFSSLSSFDYYYNIIKLLSSYLVLTVIIFYYKLFFDYCLLSSVSIIIALNCLDFILIKGIKTKASSTIAPVAAPVAAPARRLRKRVVKKSQVADGPELIAEFDESGDDESEDDLDELSAEPTEPAVDAKVFPFIQQDAVNTAVEGVNADHYERGCKLSWNDMDQVPDILERSPLNYFNRFFPAVLFLSIVRLTSAKLKLNRLNELTAAEFLVFLGVCLVRPFFFEAVYFCDYIIYECVISLSIRKLMVF
jgi:hypothetical protein